MTQLMSIHSRSKSTIKTADRRELALCEDVDRAWRAWCVRRKIEPWGPVALSQPPCGIWANDLEADIFRTETD